MKKLLLIAVLSLITTHAKAQDNLYESYLINRHLDTRFSTSDSNTASVKINLKEEVYTINIGGKNLCSISQHDLTFGESSNFNCADKYVVQVKETTSFNIFSDTIYGYFKIFDTRGNQIADEIKVDAQKKAIRGGSTSTKITKD
ncbi:MAG: hypothetical protein R2877_04290 [Bdellovibrionota bacterium]